MREGARISGIVDRPDPILAHFSVVVDWKPVMAVDAADFVPSSINSQRM